MRFMPGEMLFPGHRLSAAVWIRRRRLFRAGHRLVKPERLAKCARHDALPDRTFERRHRLSTPGTLKARKPQTIPCVSAGLIQPGLAQAGMFAQVELVGRPSRRC